MALTPKNRADYLRNLADRIDGIGKPRFNDIASGDPRALREVADAIEVLAEPPIRERSTDEKITQLSARISMLEVTRDPTKSLHEQGQETRLTRLEQRLTSFEGRFKRAGHALQSD